jgi:hypothetical protein
VLVEFYVVGLALKKNQFTGNHTANGQSTIIWPSVLFVFVAFFRPAKRLYRNNYRMRSV